MLEVTQAFSDLPDSNLRYLLLILLLLASVGGAAFVAAQIAHGVEPHAADELTGHPLSGIVLDPSGAAIAGAAVVLRINDASAPMETKTDSSGSFHFDRVASGKYD